MPGPAVGGGVVTVPTVILNHPSNAIGIRHIERIPLSRRVERPSVHDRGSLKVQPQPEPPGTDWDRLGWAK